MSARIGRALAMVLVISAASLTTGCLGNKPLLNGFTVNAIQEVSFAGIISDEPYPNVTIDGLWQKDLPGSNLSLVTEFHGVTGDFGYFFVSNGRYPAEWYSQVTGFCNGEYGAQGYFDVTTENPNINWYCAPIAYFLPDPAFSLTNSYPSSLTISGPAFSNQYGAPQIFVNDDAGDFITQESALSVNGTSATFAYPQSSAGYALTNGLYEYTLFNYNSSGSLQEVGSGFFSLGSEDTSMTTPFGVDAADVTVSSRTCTASGTGKQCTTAGPDTYQDPILTLATPGELSFKGEIVHVGTDPTAVKGYDVSTQTKITDSYGSEITTTQPSRAIVTNYGSNTVTIVDLFAGDVVQTVGVGSNHLAVCLNSGQTYAYVANYGSGPISAIDLASNSETNVIGVGPGPAAVAVDPNGSDLWVGGDGYISEINLSNLAVVSTFSVSGQVTSLGVSAGEDSLVYTLITSGSSYEAQQVSKSDGAVLASYAQSSASSYYAAQQESGVNVSPLLLSSGALVDANYANGIAVLGTPTGFVVVDLINHDVAFQGSTGNPVRGVATDPAQGVVYVAVPDSNALITVPLPPTS